jgi:hypothetical protein
VSRGDEPNLDHCFKPTDFSKKSFENQNFPLDKQHKVCYNIEEVKRGTSTANVTKDCGNRNSRAD